MSFGFESKVGYFVLLLRMVQGGFNRYAVDGRNQSRTAKESLSDGCPVNPISRRMSSITSMSAVALVVVLLFGAVFKRSRPVFSWVPQFLHTPAMVGPSWKASRHHVVGLLTCWSVNDPGCWE